MDVLREGRVESCRNSSDFLSIGETEKSVNTIHNSEAEAERGRGRQTCETSLVYIVIFNLRKNIKKKKTKRNGGHCGHGLEGWRVDREYF